LPGLAGGHAREIVVQRIGEIGQGQPGVAPQAHLGAVDLAQLGRIDVHVDNLGGRLHQGPAARDDLPHLAPDDEE
jgi:hypothetical protein